MLSARLGAFGFCLLANAPVYAQNSVCHGTPSHGSISNAVQLPSSGANFVAYSEWGARVGRNYVHSRVAEVMLAAYRELQKVRPDVTYVYGETGAKSGGRFKPHRTHQNGTSVDFMVPVIDQHGRPSQLPRSLTNRWGYDVEFDAKGRAGDVRIDFEAMGEHLYQLHRAAQRQGIDFSLVIFDATLMQSIYATTHGDYLRRHLTMMRKKPWVRHDEHYHIDFRVVCQK